MRDLLGDTENFIHNKYGYCYYSLPVEGNPIITEIRKTNNKGDIEIEVRSSVADIDHTNLVTFYRQMGLTVLGGRVV